MVMEAVVTVSLALALALGLAISPSAARGAGPCRFEALEREERTIAADGRAGDPKARIFVMRVRSPASIRRGAVVLTHGAGSGSSATWDLGHRDHSFMRALACFGFDAYALDVRGFGGSSMPEALLRPAGAGPPAVRAHEAIEDLQVVVGFATRSSSVARVDLVGWSWGADVAAMYAGAHPDRVRRLVLLSPVYDRRWPARHQTQKAWYPLTRAEVEKLYAPDKEERAVWEEWVGSLFRFAGGGVLRLPAGPYRDIYGDDAPVWDPAKVRAPVMVLRGEDDRASLDEHAMRLFKALVHAPERRYVVISGAGHFFFREKRHGQVYDAVSHFLSAPLDPAID